MTAVNAGAELGAGKSMNVTATAAGKGALTWTLVGAPAGVTIVRVAGAARPSAPPQRRSGLHPPEAGPNFQAKAALTSTPGDSAISGNILFVSVNAIDRGAEPRDDRGAVLRRWYAARHRPTSSTRTGTA